MSDGSITRFLQKKSKASMDALGVYSDNIVTGGAVQTLEDQSYKLFDRDTTVKDAAKMVQEYFNEKMSDHNVTECSDGGQKNYRVRRDITNPG